MTPALVGAPTAPDLERDAIRGERDDDENEPPPRSGDDPRRSKARRLAELLTAVPMVLSPSGRAYAIVDGTARACDAIDFRSWCAALYWRTFDDTIPDGAVRDVIRALSGSGLPTQAVPIRIGGDAARITLDLGEGAVAVTASGIDRAPDAMFARPPGSQPLPAPVLPSDDGEAAAAVEELRAVLGVEVRTWAACLAWLLAAFRPDAPYPILYIRGEQGSGKSTLARALRHVIDPRRPDMSALPREPRDLAILAEHAHVLAIDNVSTVPGEMSDALCRLATGDGFSTRALYSDRDLAVFDLARPVVMASIVDAATRPDLLDRAIIIDLPTRADRLDDDALRAAVDLVRPRVLGALLYAVAAGLRAPPATVPPEVRMRAPAAFAARAAPALGIAPETIIRAYIDSRAAAQGIAADDPIVDALLGFLRPGQVWEGTVAELLTALDDRRHGARHRGWPESPRGLATILRRLAPTLRSVGVTHAAPEAGNHRRMHRLTRAVPDYGNPQEHHDAA